MAAQEKQGETLDALNKSLHAAEHRCELMKIELKGKESEVGILKK